MIKGEERERESHWFWFSLAHSLLFIGFLNLLFCFFFNVLFVSFSSFSFFFSYKFLVLPPFLQKMSKF